ncbi:hypothetical protein H4219_004278 [Mycoemilia scoparia]|uniref:Uncharacterized protein n=1 Tax=Mycoemilia scoparia TaxID=417184 RepID=A0A9W7ZY13_9FUNG|nr:hypothetical protein H4219_004278 [Mycoemilia scoparia]
MSTHSFGQDYAGGDSSQRPPADKGFRHAVERPEHEASDEYLNSSDEELASVMRSMRIKPRLSPASPKNRHYQTSTNSSSRSPPPVPPLPVFHHRPRKEGHATQEKSPSTYDATLLSQERERQYIQTTSPSSGWPLAQPGSSNYPRSDSYSQTIDTSTPTNTADGLSKHPSPREFYSIIDTHPQTTTFSAIPISIETTSVFTNILSEPFPASQPAQQYQHHVSGSSQIPHNYSPLVRNEDITASSEPPLEAFGTRPGHGITVPSRDSPASWEQESHGQGSANRSPIGKLLDLHRSPAHSPSGYELRDHSKNAPMSPLSKSKFFKDHSISHALNPVASVPEIGSSSPLSGRISQHMTEPHSPERSGNHLPGIYTGSQNITLHNKPLKSYMPKGSLPLNELANEYSRSPNLETTSAATTSHRPQLRPQISASIIDAQPAAIPNVSIGELENAQRKYTELNNRPQVFSKTSIHALLNSSETDSLDSPGVISDTEDMLTENSTQNPFAFSDVDTKPNTSVPPRSQDAIQDQEDNSPLIPELVNMSPSSDLHKEDSYHQKGTKSHNEAEVGAYSGKLPLDRDSRLQGTGDISKESRDSIKPERNYNDNVYSQHYTGKGDEPAHSSTHTISSGSMMSQNSIGDTDLAMVSARMSLSSSISGEHSETPPQLQNSERRFELSSKLIDRLGSEKSRIQEPEDEVLDYYRQNLTTPGSRLSWEQEEEILRSQPSLSKLISDEISTTDMASIPVSNNRGYTIQKSKTTVFESVDKDSFSAASSFTQSTPMAKTPASYYSPEGIPMESSNAEDFQPPNLRLPPHPSDNETHDNSKVTGSRVKTESAHSSATDTNESAASGNAGSRHVYPTPETKNDSRFTSSTNNSVDAGFPSAPGVSNSTNPFSDAKLVQAEKARIEAEELYKLRSKAPSSPSNKPKRPSQTNSVINITRNVASDTALTKPYDKVGGIERIETEESLEDVEAPFDKTDDDSLNGDTSESGYKDWHNHLHINMKRGLQQPDLPDSQNENLYASNEIYSNVDPVLDAHNDTGSEMIDYIQLVELQAVSSGMGSIEYDSSYDGSSDSYESIHHPKESPLNSGEDETGYYALQPPTRNGRRMAVIDWMVKRSDIGGPKSEGVQSNQRGSSIIKSAAPKSHSPSKESLVSHGKDDISKHDQRPEDSGNELDPHYSKRLGQQTFEHMPEDSGFADDPLNQAGSAHGYSPFRNLEQGFDQQNASNTEVIVSTVLPHNNEGRHSRHRSVIDMVAKSKGHTRRQHSLGKVTIAGDDTPSSGTRESVENLPPGSSSAKSDALTRASVPNSSKACSVKSPTLGHCTSTHSDRKYILSLASEIPLQIMNKAGELELALCREEEDYLSHQECQFCPQSLRTELNHLVKKLLLIQQAVSMLPSKHSPSEEARIAQELDGLFNDPNQLYVAPAELLLYIRESGLNFTFPHLARRLDWEYRHPKQIYVRRQTEPYDSASDSEASALDEPGTAQNQPVPPNIILSAAAIPKSTIRRAQQREDHTNHHRGINAHLQYMSVINQLMVVALRIYHRIDHEGNDFGQKDHRFIAHQLSVLYQSLGGDFKKYKKPIESAFEKIKTQVANPTPPPSPHPPTKPISTEPKELSVESITWLKNILSDLIADALYQCTTSIPLIESRFFQLQKGYYESKQQQVYGLSGEKGQGTSIINWKVPSPIRGLPTRPILNYISRELPPPSKKRHGHNRDGAWGRGGATGRGNIDAKKGGNNLSEKGKANKTLVGMAAGPIGGQAKGPPRPPLPAFFAERRGPSSPRKHNHRDQGTSTNSTIDYE